MVFQSRIGRTQVFKIKSDLEVMPQAVPDLSLIVKEVFYDEKILGLEDLSSYLFTYFPPDTIQHGLTNLKATS
jgi:hypothetical protein